MLLPNLAPFVLVCLLDPVVTESLGAVFDGGIGVGRHLVCGHDIA